MYDNFEIESRKIEFNINKILDNFKTNPPAKHLIVLENDNPLPF